MARPFSFANSELELVSDAVGVSLQRRLQAWPYTFGAHMDVGRRGSVGGAPP